MSTQQDIYVAGSKKRPPMLTKDNYVPWSSRLLRYAKSDQNREVLVNETFHEQTNDELTEKELKHVEVDDQAIQTILLGLPEDIYAAVDSCETAQEIWLRVQQMMKDCSTGHEYGSRPTYADGWRQWWEPVQYVGQNVGNQNGYNAVQNVRNQNPNGNGNVVAARAEGNAIKNDENQIRCYNYRGLAGIQLQAKEFDLMATAANLDEIEEVNANCILIANLQQASTSGTQTDKALVYDSDISVEVHNYDDCYDNERFNMFTQEEQYTELLEPIPEPHQV
ncbi:hypothetical protein Tco_0410049 [Tanacetum coccineum]